MFSQSGVKPPQIILYILLSTSLVVGGRMIVVKKKVSSKIAQCLCGGIKIKVKGKLGNVINCHCSQCRKTHGNYAAYTCCPEENVTFISKKTLKWYQSSNIAKRGFCSRCGASMFYKLLKSKELDIAAGMFNNPTTMKTTSNIFTKDKLDYYELDLSLPAFERVNK